MWITIMGLGSPEKAHFIGDIWHKLYSVNMNQIVFFVDFFLNFGFTAVAVLYFELTRPFNSIAESQKL